MAQVLIVEDDTDLNRAYQMILENEGHKVVTAFNGAEALEALKTFNPDLILLDLLMPVMGGLDFLKNFDPKARKKVKVLIFTNMENSPEVSEAYNLGAHRAIIKSWTAPQNLSRIVRGALEEEPSTPVAG